MLHTGEFTSVIGPSSAQRATGAACKAVPCCNVAFTKGTQSLKDRTRLAVPKSPPASAPGSVADSWASRVSGVTDLTSISQQNTHVNDALAASITKLVTQLSEQKDLITSLSKRVEEFSPPADEKTKRCYYCRQTGHEADDCPKLLAKKKREADEKLKSDQGQN